MLARAFSRALPSLRGHLRRLPAWPWRTLLGAAPAALLAVVLAACAPALSAAPAAGTGAGGAGASAGSNAAAEASGGSVDGAAGVDAAGPPPAPVPAPVAVPAIPGAAVRSDAASTATPGADSVAAPQAGPARNDPAANAAPPAPGDPPSQSDPPAPSSGLAAGVQEGIASWYGPNFAGRLTSDGEVFDPSKLTAAHRTLPFGTLVKVTNLANGKSVVVRINDRGPFKPNRIIDLSEGAAKAIGMFRMGVARVRLEPLSLPDGVVRLGVDAKLSGYRVLSRFHKVGQLLLLSKRNGADPVVVRVVGTDVPPSSGADVLVANEVYRLIGSQAHVTDR